MLKLQNLKMRSLCFPAFFHRLSTSTTFLLERVFTFGLFQFFVRQ